MASSLAAALLAVALYQAPPGRSSFSLMPATSCDHGCRGARQSSFFGGLAEWESSEAGERRYALNMSALSRAATVVHAEHPDGWSKTNLAAMGLAAAIIESGLREDVQNGRGSARKADDAGGRGRGPGGEACAMQIHPSVAWRFAPAPKEMIEAARDGAKGGREALQQWLLGEDGLERCYVTGLRMLATARERCVWMMKGKGLLDWATFALYVTGSSCTANPGNKTWARTSLYRRIRPALQAELAK